MKEKHHTKVKKVKVDNYHKYFVAIIPPEETACEIHRLKLLASERYQSCAALNSPPHITLHMPFRWKKEKEDELISFFESQRQAREGFRVYLRGVGHFDQRVIFLAVKECKALHDYQRSLTGSMRRELRLFNSTHRDRGFHPHMTIAFRDLKKDIFPQAYQYFEKLKPTFDFEVTNYSLLRHDGEKWQEYRTFSF